MEIYAVRSRLTLPCLSRGNLVRDFPKGIPAFAMEQIISPTYIRKQAISCGYPSEKRKLTTNRCIVLLSCVETEW